jgi:hypothetical protein
MVTMRHDAAGASYGGTNVFKLGVTATLPDLDPNEVEVWGGQLESSNKRQTTQWQHVAMTWKSGEAIRFPTAWKIASRTDADPASTSSPVAPS